MVKLTTLAFALLILAGSNVALGESPILASNDNPNAVPLGWFKLSGLVSPEGLEGPEGVLGSGLVPDEKEFDFYGGFACNGLPTIGSWNDSNHVVLRFCGATGTLNVRVDASPSYCMDAKIGDAPLANYLQIDLVNRAKETTVRFRNVVLSLRGRRIPLGSFEGSGWNTWHVQGIDLSQGFTLEGDVLLNWPANPATIGQETNKLTVKLGTIPSTATASIGEYKETAHLDAFSVAQR
jgi:hypothetical protein